MHKQSLASSIEVPESQAFRIVSTPAIHTPGVFRFILAGMRDGSFSASKATELFSALGLPAPVAVRLAAKDSAVTYEIHDETVTVTVHALLTVTWTPTQRGNLATFSNGFTLLCGPEGRGIVTTPATDGVCSISTPVKHTGDVFHSLSRGQWIPASCRA